VRQLLVTANVVPSLLILVTLMMRRYVPLKRLLLQEPHGVTSQKTAFFIKINFVIYLSMGWSGTKSTITVAINWPIVPALEDRW
jgi:hypothetical protein